MIYREGRVSGTREIVVHPNYVLIYRIGVDAVWINPWYRSPLLDGGYDVADYRAGVWRAAAIPSILP